MANDLIGEHRLKVPVVRREHYTIMLEEHMWGTFAHADVYKWTPAIAKDFKRAWETLTDLHGGPIYVYHDCSDHLLEKFIQRLGFRLLRPWDQTHDIWIWSNNGKSLQD